MKKALLIVCAVVCSIFYVSAQQYQDVIYLKNGSVVRGVIMEQIPGKTIKVATDNGSHFIFKLEEVDKMTKELPQQYQPQPKYQQQPKYQPQPQYQQPHPAPVARAPRAKSAIDWSPRYKGEINVGYAIAGSKFDGQYYYEDSYGDSVEEPIRNVKTELSRPLIETIHGVEVGPYFFFGAGFGLQYYCGKTHDVREIAITDASYDKAERWNGVMLPLFANIKFMYPINNFTPFLTLSLGGTIGCYSSLNDTAHGEEEYGDPYYGYYGYYEEDCTMKTRGGFYCDFGAGFRYKAFNFSMGLQHQVVKTVYTVVGYDSEEGNYDYKVINKIPVNAFYVKIGVNF